MTEETKQPETGTAPGTQLQEPNQQAEPVLTLTQSALNAMLADQKRSLLSEVEQLRGKASKWEEYEKAQMSKEEQLQARIAELESRAAIAQQYEASIKAILEVKLQSIPEQFRDVVPEGTPAQQLEWIEKAQAKGMFTLQSQQQTPKPTPPRYESGTGSQTGQGTGLTPAEEAVAQRLGVSLEQYKAQKDALKK
jgi:hypothetical protein